MNKRAVLYAGAAVMLLSAAISTYSYATSDSSSQRVDSTRYADMAYEEKYAYWESRIAENGGAAAYGELADIISDYPFGQFHREAHIFGDALYQVEGLRGVAVCDARFLYGCIHALSISATQLLGPEHAQELYDACREASRVISDPCAHGIGHSLVARAAGGKEYMLPDLMQALESCDSLMPTSDPINGCHGGAFMEYTLRSMNTGTTTPRELRPHEALEPCVSLPHAYQAACAFKLPGWWIEANPERKDHLTMAKKMGRWCSDLSPDRTVTGACLDGVAFMMQVLSDDDPARTAIVCGLVTSDPEYRYQCHYNSALRFTLYHPVSEALGACDGLSDKEKNVCVKDALAISAKQKEEPGRDPPPEERRLTETAQ